MLLGLHEEAKAKVDKSIFITGSARSGTTIMGQLVHSLSCVEYSFEPPTLFSLIPLIGQIEKEHWQLLFRTYLYEDFFVNAISGRNLNFNPHDDSYVLNAKSSDLINERHNGSLRKGMVDNHSANGNIAFKMPDMVPFLDSLNDYFPDLRLITMTRNPLAVINSLLSKAWFSDHSLKNENKIYPTRSYRSYRMPFWLKEEDFDYWIGLDELNRCAFYVSLMEPKKVSKTQVLVNYDEFVLAPRTTLDKICNEFGLSYGEKTEQILTSIKPTSTKIVIDESQIIPGIKALLNLT